jgi:hypothetical protein
MIGTEGTTARGTDATMLPPTRSRSDSIESNHSSQHPSIADSVTRLIPLSHPHSSIKQITPDKRFVPGVPISEEMSIKTNDQTEQVGVSTKNDLTAEQRQVLLRRVKVLEKRLGEPLMEDEMSRLVVQPTTADKGDKSPRAPERHDTKGQQLADLYLTRSKTIDSAWSREILERDEDREDRAQRRRQLAKVSIV